MKDVNFDISQNRIRLRMARLMVVINARMAFHSGSGNILQMLILSTFFSVKPNWPEDEIFDITNENFDIADFVANDLPMPDDLIGDINMLEVEDNYVNIPDDLVEEMGRTQS